MTESIKVLANNLIEMFPKGKNPILNCIGEGEQRKLLKDWLNSLMNMANLIMKQFLNQLKSTWIVLIHTIEGICKS